MIAQQIRASLLARATATTRSGLFFLIAAIQSAKPPLYLAATRGAEVQPTTSILRKYRLPFLVMAPSLSLPPLECWLGVSPIEALKSLPDLKTLGSGVRAAIADAISGPKAGISSSNWLVWFLPLARAIVFSRSAFFFSRPPLWRAQLAAACF